MRSFLKLLSLALVAISLQGCAAAIIAKPFNAGGAKFAANAIATADENAATIIVYRPDTFVGSANWDVPILHLNGKSLGPIRINGYMILPVQPGDNHIKTTEVLFGSDTGKIRGDIALSMEQGKTLYLKYEESIRSVVPIPAYNGVAVIVSGAYSFQPVPPETALAELEGTRRLEIAAY